MAGHLRQRDLLAGSAAAAILLLTVALGLTPWLAIPGWSARIASALASAA